MDGTHTIGMLSFLLLIDFAKASSVFVDNNTIATCRYSIFKQFKRNKKSDAITKYPFLDSLRVYIVCDDYADAKTLTMK